MSEPSAEYKFPVIDLTDWEKNRATIANEIDTALRTIGFACYTNPPIDFQIIEHCFGVFRHYFNKDMAWKEKQLTPYGVQKNGFMSTKFASVPWKKQSPDSKEFYKLYTNISLPDIETSTGESIPKELIQMDTVVNEFRTQTYQLIDMFLKLHSLALGQPEDFLTNAHGTNGTSIRCNHYPIVTDFTPTSEETQSQQLQTDLGKPTNNLSTDPVFVRNAAHTDLNSLTLLFLEANDPGGLEIWDDNVSCWRPMTFLKNSIIVNTGKMMVRWTNDQYHANIHRVVGTRDSCKVDRYSIAVFITPERASVIKPLVPEGDKPHYDDITVGAFIDQLNKRTE